MLGDGADLATVAALAGVTIDQATSAATELVRAEILQPDVTAAFVHPLVGAVVASDLPPIGRAARHEEAARLLAAAGAPAEQIAAHLKTVPPRETPASSTRCSEPRRPHSARVRRSTRSGFSAGRSPSRPRRSYVWTYCWNWAGPRP